MSDDAWNRILTLHLTKGRVNAPLNFATLFARSKRGAGPYDDGYCNCKESSLGCPTGIFKTLRNPLIEQFQDLPDHVNSISLTTLVVRSLFFYFSAGKAGLRGEQGHPGEAGKTSQPVAKIFVENFRKTRSYWNLSVGRPRHSRRLHPMPTRSKTV